MARLELEISLFIVLALAACEGNTGGPLPEEVLVTTNAREYEVSFPPHAAFVTLENRTRGVVTVRRCLVGNSPVDPVGVDVVVEKQGADGTWRTVDIGFDCEVSGSPRADALLAPTEAALVLRLNSVEAGRFRVRVAYGLGAGVAPTDTATSATFVYR